MIAGNTVKYLAKLAKQRKGEREFNWRETMIILKTWYAYLNRIVIHLTYKCTANRGSMWELWTDMQVIYMIYAVSEERDVHLGLTLQQ